MDLCWRPRRRWQLHTKVCGWKVEASDALAQYLYNLEDDKIGEGAFAHDVAATHRELEGERVALKVLTRMDQEDLQDLRSESSILEKLSGEQLFPVLFDSKITKRTAYIAMTLYNGMMLDEFI